MIEILELVSALFLITGGLVIAYKSSRFVFRRGRGDDENGGQMVFSRKF